MSKFGFLIVIIFFTFLSCADRSSTLKQETVLTGKATFLVEESMLPITEDVAMVFESQYNAKLSLVPLSEAEIINALQNKRATVAILPRKLDSIEIGFFNSRKIFPKETPFGSDAIALIQKRTVRDSLIDLKIIADLLNGSPSQKIKGLVFDNLNSAAARQLMQLAGVTTFPENGVYSFSTNEAVIRYVAAHEGIIGVVGVNWLLQPQASSAHLLDQIKVLKIKGDGGYYGPSQENIATGKYPLVRDLFVINMQGYQGLGIGFSSFIAGERGQRIILKSGLLPIRMPTRKILTRPSIEKNRE